MLADGKIDSLDTHLEQFKLNNKTLQKDLENLLKEYGQLLDDYKTLKKAFEGKGTKAVATSSTDRMLNPYVLVLIDGNNYIFNDELIHDKQEGGMRAARMLNDAVERYLRQSVSETRTSRIVVRIYADLTILSKQLAKSKVIGMEKRSISPFSAGFTRAISLFDFVDALDEEGTKFKIREQFRLAAEDNACSHIMYAACHDSAYLSQLVPLGGRRDKIIQGAGWNSEFHQFNLNVTQFPTVFRWSDLSTAVPNPKTAPTKGSAAPIPTTTPNTMAPTIPTGLRQRGPWSGDPMNSRGSYHGADDTSSLRTDGFDAGTGFDSSEFALTPKKQKQQACKYFAKGLCRFGDKCTFKHVSKDVKDAGMPHDSLHGSSRQCPDDLNMGRSNTSSSLPTTLPPGFIPLNEDSQRLDTYVRSPTQEEWAIYNTRFHKQKPCNSFHMQRVCTSFACPFDHRELEPESRHVLKYVLKCNPCPQKSACRHNDCYYGHLCQKDGCQGQMKGCRMKADLHVVDPRLASMVPAEDGEELVHGEGVELPVEKNFLW